MTWIALTGEFIVDRIIEVVSGLDRGFRWKVWKWRVGTGRAWLKHEVVKGISGVRIVVTNGGDGGILDYILHEVKVWRSGEVKRSLCYVCLLPAGGTGGHAKRFLSDLPAPGGG